MATINLGAIKFKWQGAYNAGTAYTVDDVVSYNGSSYICILASTGNLPTNATYWEQMSSAGTNGTDGTDLTTTLTTQGDIVYRDASGLARLGAGTSGQALITNGTGANPSWGDVSGGLVQTIQSTHSSLFDCTSTSFVTTGFSATITPTSSSNKILILIQTSAYLRTTGQQAYFDIDRNGTSLTYASTGLANIFNDVSSDIQNVAVMYLDSPSSTSALTYTLFTKRNTNTLSLNSQGCGTQIILQEVS